MTLQPPHPPTTGTLLWLWRVSKAVQTNAILDNHLRLSKTTILDYSTEYSETLGLGLDQFYGLGLGLEAETQIISVSDSVSILRL